MTTQLSITYDMEKLLFVMKDINKKKAWYCYTSYFMSLDQVLEILDEAFFQILELV